MYFEEIKKIIIEKKKYFIIFAVIAGLFIFYQNNKQAKTENNLLSSPSEQNSKQLSKTKNEKQASSNGKVTCDISGAINEEGVYTLQSGARLQDLIEAAGGLKSRAQIKAINRALLLKDQDKIYIPYKGEKVENEAAMNSASGKPEKANASSSASSSDKVNLNTASAADLQKLNGIGEKKAEQIIAYREQKGQFKKIEDLKEVSGIGDKTFAALKDHLEV